MFSHADIIPGEIYTVAAHVLHVLASRPAHVKGVGRMLRHLRLCSGCLTEDKLQIEGRSGLADQRPSPRPIRSFQGSLRCVNRSPDH